MVRPGDILHLKSGSPKMVVVGIQTIGVDIPLITTTWVAFNTGVPHQITAPLVAFKRGEEANNRWSDEVPF